MMLTPTRLLASLLAALAPLVFAPAAAAAPVTVTTSPPTIYLFVVLTPAAAGKAPWTEIAHTFDKTACDAMLYAWAPLVAPAKLACLPFDNLAMSNSYAE